MKTRIHILFIVLALSAYSVTVKCQNSPDRNSSAKRAALGTLNRESPSPQHVPGVITIKLREGVGDFGKQDGTVRFGIESLDSKVADFQVNRLDKRFRFNPAKMRAGLPDLSRIYKISFPENISLTKVVQAFSSDPNVEYAEPVPVYHTADVPGDALYSQMQHLPQIFAEQAWAIHKGENGTEEIVIAIVDTGVDWEHEDLQSNIWQNLTEDADGDGHTTEFNGTQWVLDPGDLNGIDEDANGFTDDLAGWNFINSSGDPNPIPGNPDGGHGTHCAGIAAASTNNGVGVASISWNLSVMAICVDGGNGFPNAWDGIIYAAENGADVISNSWGGFAYSFADQEVVAYATGLGSIVLAAAHNQNYTELVYPAAYPGVISVASVNSDDTKADYSNYNVAVDISAPGGGTGGGILSTLPGNSYDAWYGTSMATPMVAGCLGLLKSYHPDWTNEQLITQVLGTTDNIDAINPGYENMLGTGRVNAFRMLSEENVTLPQVLQLGLTSSGSLDANGNQINEPGEEVTLNIEFFNFDLFSGDDDVTVTLTTQDPDITILAGTGLVDIPPDGFFGLDEPFQILVNPGASCHFAELTIHFESDLPIVVGQDITLSVLVAPSGTFVYEGANGEDYSGTYIAGVLDQLGYQYLYSNIFPYLRGFETVFLSFGNFESGSIYVDDAMANNISGYLEAGGNIYLEGSDVLGYDQAANTQLLDLFGLASATDGSTNPINSLIGQSSSLTNEMLFTGNSQASNSWIDKYVPGPDATIAFFESNYGTVAVQHVAPDGRKTFCFSYSLADLTDGETPNTREELLNRILNFFDIYTAVTEREKSAAMRCKIYPNPMKTEATFHYYLPEDNHTVIEIFNATGQQIMQPLNGRQTAGDHTIPLDAGELQSGIYFYTIRSGNLLQTGKIIVLN